MLFQSASQFTVLALLLVAGWFFGMASRGGTRKWKDQIRDAEVEQARLKDQLAARDKQILALTQERDATLAKVGAPALSRGPAADTGGWRGWFGWGRDNLARINGIDEAGERALNERGYKTYREIEGMSPYDEATLEDALGLESGTIAKQGWRNQARMLREGNEVEHATKYA